MLDLERPEHAYLLGFLLGDGTLYSGRGRKGRLSVEISERDAPLLLLLAPLLPGALLGTRSRATNFSRESRTVVLSWCRLDVREALSQAGMPTGKKDTVVAPPQVPFSRRDFARGFFDADGSIGFTAKRVPFLSLVTRSESMAQWWCEVLREVTGAQRSARPNARDGVANVMVQTDAAVALAVWLYRPDDLALPRKSCVARDVAAWRRPAGMRATSSRRPWTVDEDAVVLADEPVAVIAQRLARSTSSVDMRRWRLRASGVPVPLPGEQSPS